MPRSPRDRQVEVKIQPSGGISQQPEHMRLPSQLRDATNAEFNVADGFSKRPGTTFLTRFAGLTGAKLRLHGYKRDESESYVIVYGTSGGSPVLRVFDLASGVEATVNDVSSAGAATAYLDANTATADQLRMTTIGDTTIIVNTTVTPAAKNSPTYTVEQEWTTYSRMRSHSPDPMTYHRVTMDEGSFQSGYYLYDPSPDITGNATFCRATFAPISGGTYANPRGNWDQIGTLYGFQIRFRRRTVASNNTAWNWTASTKRLRKIGATSWDDYAWRSEDEILITGGTGVTTGYAKVAKKIDADELELAESIKGTDASDVSFSTTNTITEAYEVIYPADTVAKNDMYEVAAKLQDILQASGCDDGLIEYVSLGSENGYFVITGPYRGSTRTVVETSAPSAGSGATDLSAAGLPFDNAAATFSAGTDPGSVSPTYAVDLRWTRVASPSSTKGSIDETLAPVKLTRTVVGSPATFELDTIDWSNRLDGDQNSNPPPAIFDEGIPINDVQFFNGRLVLIGGRWFVASAANDLYNFYNDDVANIVDSDPISAQVAGGKVSVLDYAVPFRNTLLLFSVAGEQYQLDTKQPLTPTNVSFTNVMSYKTVRVRPEAMGSTLYFACNSKAGAFCSLFEGYFDDQFATTDATDVSAHVPELVATGVSRITAHHGTRQVVCFSYESDLIYAYKAHWDNQTKRQSAWTKWTMDAGYRISDCVIVDDDLWFLTEFQSQWILEKMPLTRDYVSGFAYAPRLDRRVYVTGSHSAGTTTFTLPSSLSDTTINKMVLGTGFANSGEEIAVTGLGTTATVAGNYSGSTVCLGRSYNLSCSLSRPYPRDENGRPVFFERFPIQNVVTNHVNAGAYTIATVLSNGPTSSRAYVPTNTYTVDSSGAMQAWVMGDSERATITITSGAAAGVTITGIQFIGELAEGLR